MRSPAKQPSPKLRLPTLGRSGGVSLLLATIAILVFVPAASADMVLGSGSGSGAGQTKDPEGIAVDRSTGNVYVADFGNDRVVVFGADGGFIRAFGWGVKAGDTSAAGLDNCTTATGCQAGFAGSAPGQFDGPTRIAVDNFSLEHDVYVYDEGNSRVQKFTPSGVFLLMLGGGVDKGGGTPSHPGNLCTAEYLTLGDTCGSGMSGTGPGEFSETNDDIGVGPAGTVYVASGPKRVQKFNSGGVVQSDLSLAPAGAGSNLNGFAVDSTGAFYVASDAIRKYDAAGNFLSEINPSFNLLAIATDASDNLFVSDNTDANSLLKYDSSGTLLRVFYGDETLKARGIPLPTPALRGTSLSAKDCLEKTWTGWFTWRSLPQGQS